MWKRVAAVLALLLAGVGIAAWIWLARLDGVVLNGIEQSAAAAGVKVKVDAVSVSLWRGSLVVEGLSVANPPGFTTPYALHVARIYVRAEIGSVMGNGPVVVDKVSIVNPELNYEVNGTQGLTSSSISNLGVLQKNANGHASAGPGRKQIVKLLVVTDGRIAISASVLKAGRLSEKLPEIVLRDLGTAKGGASSSEIGAEVLDAIVDQAALTAIPALVKGVTGVGGGLLDKVKGLF